MSNPVVSQAPAPTTINSSTTNVVSKPTFVYRLGYNYGTISFKVKGEEKKQDVKNEENKTIEALGLTLLQRFPLALKQSDC